MKLKALLVSFVFGTAAAASQSSQHEAAIDEIGSNTNLHHDFNPDDNRDDASQFISNDVGGIRGFGQQKQVEEERYSDDIQKTDGGEGGEGPIIDWNDVNAANQSFDRMDLPTLIAVEEALRQRKLERAKQQTAFKVDIDQQTRDLNILDDEAFKFEELLLNKGTGPEKEIDCVDDPDFRFIYTNKKGKEKEKGDCDFVAKERTKKRCGKIMPDGVKVKDACPVTCQSCNKVPTAPLPNILVFLVDDLGYNQVGYHAEEVGNDEVKTPSIDEAAKSGVIIDRGYMTPWCAPSRATFQTGRTNSFNQNVSNDIFSFDDDIGFVGGMPPGTVTLAKALKDYSSTTGKGVYKASYAGKWGIGGTAWANTPMGVGYDEFTGFFGDSIESCDGWQAFLTSPPSNPNTAQVVSNANPGYWQQSRSSADNSMCPYLRGKTDVLTQEEMDIACKTTPRTPPKLIDLDLMEQTVSAIRNHDYENGPLYHMHAPQLMHLPIQYPKSYEGDNAGTEKENATNDDIRSTTNNALRFVDDIFSNITQAIKDANQWDNTIVLFSSDNGGAIYTNTVNNNYPLRGAKFNSFEGGLRVPQFLSGGWIEKNLPEDRSNVSPTYVFVNDWGPTLLEMIGANKRYLLGNRTGASYGNEMWTFIKNSVSNNNSNDDDDDDDKKAQKKRLVSYSTTLFFNVTEDATFKMYYMGDNGVYSPRHWAPTWPLKDELIPDLGYQSIRPCRPDGEALECCYFDVESDSREDRPIKADCDALKEEGISIYGFDICDEQPQICYTSSEVVETTDVNEYSLWSHYGATGPFCSKDAQPVGSDLDMLCICDGFSLLPNASSAEQSKIKSFTPSVFTPYVCSDEPAVGEITVGNDTTVTLPGVNCSGGFARVPQGGIVQAYVDQGISERLVETILAIPNNVVVPELIQALSEYITRKGYVEWPSFSKFPYVGFGLDSCPLKKATIVPIPPESLNPWLNISPEGSPTNPTPTETLCTPWTPRIAWCPSKKNPSQQYVKSWDYDRLSAFGTFEDDSLFLPIVGNETMNVMEVCKIECSKDPSGTAYIGDSSSDQWGIKV